MTSLTDRHFVETVTAIDRAPITDRRRHQLTLIAIGCRFLEAGGGIVPRQVEALEVYMTLATEGTANSTKALSYADILNELERV